MVDSKISIKTDRFLLRPLTVEDATPQYASWLDVQSKQGFIVSAKQKNSVKRVREYIQEREKNSDILFLGIFTHDGACHIGNIKYEPINRTLKYAVMGIMIGEKEWQGIGVASEVILASGVFLRQSHGIEEIVLGVDTNNTPAIRAYEKAGFVIKKTVHVSVGTNNTVSMVLDLN